ncbi:hypothetical protein Cgig2_023838 [Carnegiea gigantea]|uniref:WAT1-related protein n=1 Tax=Carnegiea gigantea TaxID=171969 RepID=A0A9Q1K9C9_9CARY|nr:hypothetical protein Cgig2_023838 [Carnegiea gigantea]
MHRRYAANISKKSKVGRKMGVWEDCYLPVIGMVSLEFIYATMILMNRVALVKGLSPRIFVFYRQACATLFTSPIACLSREETNDARMDFRLFLLIFITSFVGIALFQNLYIEGLYLASSSVTSAMFNLVPAVTFLMAATLGLEQVNVKRLSNVAKMLGTTFCVGGSNCNRPEATQRPSIIRHPQLVSWLFATLGKCILLVIMANSTGLDPFSLWNQL